MSDEFFRLGERRKDLIKRVRAAERLKERVIESVQGLLKRLNSGELARSEYFSEIEKLFGERTPQEWVDYYDDYIFLCKKHLEDCEREIKRVKVKKGIFPVLLAGLLVFVLVFSFYAGRERILFAPPEIHTQSLDIDTSEGMTYNWIVENPGTLLSAGVSGLIEGDGEVRVYLVSGSEEWLVLDSAGLSVQFSPEGALLAEEVSVALVEEPPSLEEPVLPPEEELENPIEESTLPPAQVEEETSVLPEEEPALPPTPEEPPFEEPPFEEPALPPEEEPPLPPEDNEAIPPEEPALPPEENITTREFFEMCEETCDLSGLELSEDSYKLRIEVSGARLKLDTITYEILVEEPALLPEENVTLPPENETNITLPEENVTLPDVNVTNVTKREEKTPWGKKIVVSGPIGVIVSTEIPRGWKIRDASSIKVYSAGRARLVDFDAKDSDNDGVVDEIVFVTDEPEQTFEVIVITKASHLDSNRSFVSDIYEDVRELDGVWSEAIPAEDYVRVSFERNLTSENDITLYPRVVSGMPRIEVYEIDGTEVIVEFTDLVSGEYNSIYLTALEGEQGVFDLRVLDGDVELEHIIDPVALPEPGPGERELRVQSCEAMDRSTFYGGTTLGRVIAGLATAPSSSAASSLKTPPSQQTEYTKPCDGYYPNPCPVNGGNDLLSCNGDVSETQNYQNGRYAGVSVEVYNSPITDCGSIDSVELCYEWHTVGQNLDNCRIEVSSGDGSYSTVSTICPDISTIGLTCTDVTSLEPWSCENFFGADGNRAVARNRVRGTGAAEILATDSLFFKVGYSQAPITIMSIVSVDVQLDHDDVIEPIPGDVKPVLVTIVAQHPGGADNLADDALVEFTPFGGGVVRVNEPCTTTDLDYYSREYSCTVNMPYYDVAAYRDVYAEVWDSTYTNSVSETLPLAFWYNWLKAVGFPSENPILGWGTLFPGALNQHALDWPFVLLNHGNVEILDGEVTLTATNLGAIPASAFSVDVVEVPDCNGVSFENGIPVVIPGAFLQVSTDSTTGEEDLFFCLDVPSGLPAQTYSGTWEIIASAGALAIRRRRKLRKKLKALKKLKKEIKELEMFAHSEIEIPVGLFRTGGSGVLCSYLKEKGLKVGEIAKVLNRNWRTVGVNCRKAKKVSVGKTNYVSVKIFSDRRLSVLESLVYYLAKKGMRNAEIASLLGKDPRNVWTLYSRAVRKLRRLC